MAAEQHTRTALSEIPDRLEALRMATTTPTGIFENRIQDNAAIIPAQLDNTTNVALSQEYMLSPVPSPDELVIKQRGRRRFTTTWSPGKAANATPLRSPFQRTPTKMPLSNSMILRSSPRKRLTMGTTPPEPTLLVSSPIKVGPKQLWPGTPMPKKLRLNGEEEYPMVRLNNETPLATLLQGMSQQQLIDIIVCKTVASDAKVEEKLRAQLPLPDIEPLEQELLHAKRNIFKSLPTSRLCKKTDSTAYSRASVHLAEFKRLLSLHTKQLHDSTNWDALLDYIIGAWPCVRATPQWDSTVHNTVRRQCFKILSCHCIAAIQYGGLRLGVARLHTLERNLREWSKDFEEVITSVNALNKILAKGRSSL